MTDPKGLYPKYRVERTDGKPVGWCFVIEDTDPLAPEVLEAYALAIPEGEEGKLFDDLMEKANQIRRMHAAFDGETWIDDAESEARS